MTEASNDVCVSCRKPRAQHHCGLCGDPVCRSCAIFLDETTFAFRSQLSDDLKHSYYCAPCHQAQVQPEIEAYNEILERAREVFFFFNTAKHPIPVLRKAKFQIDVPNCVDRDETILRLGYLAAEAGFNAVVEAEVGSEKVRDHGWQKSRWRGRGIPAEVDVEKLERHTRGRERF